MSRSDDIIAALTQAAENGSLSACFVLGRLYDEGWGVRHNPRAAARWYLRAGEGGLPEALYFVASAYDAGDGIAPDPKKALAYYRRAAATGDGAAKLVLATRVLTGRGVRKDEARGLLLLRKLGRDDPDAMDWLAYHYLEKRRFSLARKWASRAVRHGGSEAPARLREIERAHGLHLERRARSSSR